MYKKRKGRKSYKPSKAEFEFQYYILDKSAKELSEYYKVKEHTIYNWAHSYRKEEESTAS